MSTIETKTCPYCGIKTQRKIWRVIQWVDL